MKHPDNPCPQETWKSQRARLQTLLYNCVVAPNILDLREKDFTINVVREGEKITEMTIRRKKQRI
ncbi:MAG: hypothetical protein PVF15_06670 [Candidatus Bathyarchaeota archaeon]